ncbi:MAG: hypothetical protein J3K34DRAFT_455284 [Monoraphidium minutum]|nr:MAG: hypothetical protein J3K34DRAFT_455284 [Monoraphidium minutum]
MSFLRAALLLAILAFASAVDTITPRTRSEWRRAQALARDTGRTDQLSQVGSRRYYYTDHACCSACFAVLLLRALLCPTRSSPEHLAYAFYTKSHYILSSTGYGYPDLPEHHSRHHLLSSTPSGIMSTDAVDPSAALAAAQATIQQQQAVLDQTTAPHLWTSP